MNCTILARFGFVLLAATFASAGAPAYEYKVLPPVTKGNLTLYPIVGGAEANTSQLLTLDEGLRSGTVIVTEAGSQQGLIRPGSRYRATSGGEVNRLVLVNNSDRPLLLLAGEVVTGGKQDRVIGVDRLVPPKSAPIDLSVFCVEPGRWVASSEHFSSMSSAMAQPSVRMPAMAARDQHKVWDMVASVTGSMAMVAPQAGPAIHNTTSYAKAMQNPEVEKRVSSIAGDYDGLLHELRKVGAKGVVVAINGRITWADVFASTDLLEKYWQKLIRSYVAESLTNGSAGARSDQDSAQTFLDQVKGTREVTDTEPGLFRSTEITGNGYKVFALTSLLPKYEYTVHLAKMSCTESVRPGVYPMGVVR
jgi:ARG and Rhodanese-Phosphatase-superfamily-associated Protein domain